jgi:hypothetical protein
MSDDEWELELDRGWYVYKAPEGLYESNLWFDSHLASQAKLRREIELLDMQKVIGRDLVLQREALRKRKEKEEREAEARRAEERKRAKQAKKEIDKRAKDWKHDDFSKGRESMWMLLLCLKRGTASMNGLYRVAGDIGKYIFVHVKDECFDYYESLIYRLEDFALPNLQLLDLDLRWWTDPIDVYNLLSTRVEWGVKRFEGDGEAIAVLSLLECAKRKGTWLWYIAERFTQNALRQAQVEKADITREELFAMFFEAIDRPYGGALWNLSTKRNKNMDLFRSMRLEGVKEKWPRANHAIRILDTIHERNPNWLWWLADKVADVVKVKKTIKAEYVTQATEEENWALEGW